MSRVLYAKYNRLRRAEYRTRTCIREENGERFVEKAPLHEKAGGHLLKMKEHREMLAALLPKLSFLSVAESMEEGAAPGTLVFPYIKGENEAALLAKAAAQGEEALLAAWEAFFDKILPEKGALVPFDNSEAFIRVFGNREELTGMPSMSPANIDCVPENMIRRGDETVCLDFEWVLEAAVPVDFLRYRAIRYFYEAYPNLDALIPAGRVYDRFGLEAHLTEIFSDMELSFQGEVFGRETDERYTENYKQPLITPADRAAKEAAKDREIEELKKVVEHYRGVEQKLRKIGVWQALSGAQKLVRKLKK